jgi:hypothetical protein
MPAFRYIKAYAMKKILEICLISILLISCRQATGQYFVSTARRMGLFGGCPCNVKLKSGQELNGEITSLNWKQLQIETDKGEKIKVKKDEIRSVSFDKTRKKHYHLWLTDESSELLRKNKNLAAKDTFIFEYVEGEGLLQWLNPGFSDKIKVYAYEVRENVPFEEAEEEDEEGNIITRKENGKISTSMKYLIVKSKTTQIIIDKSNYLGVLKEVFSDCPKMFEGFFDEKMRWNDIARHIYIYDKMCR